MNVSKASPKMGLKQVNKDKHSDNIHQAFSKVRIEYLP